eukprot:1139279-Pelagomonas_calceolata.AAC.6
MHACMHGAIAQHSIAAANRSSGILAIPCMLIRQHPLRGAVRIALCRALDQLFCASTDSSALEIWFHPCRCKRLWRPCLMWLGTQSTPSPPFASSSGISCPSTYHSECTRHSLTGHALIHSLAHAVPAPVSVSARGTHGACAHMVRSHWHMLSKHLSLRVCTRQLLTRHVLTKVLTHRHTLPKHLECAIWSKVQVYVSIK